jgi:hypothetical protein
MPREPLKVLADLNGRVERAQRALAEYLPNESGISPEDAISNVLGVLDDREFLKIQAEGRKLPGEQPALFTAD